MSLNKVCGTSRSLLMADEARSSLQGYFEFGNVINIEHDLQFQALDDKTKLRVLVNCFCYVHTWELAFIN